MAKSEMLPPPPMRSMTALRGLSVGNKQWRLQQIDDLRTKQNVALLQIIELEKRLEIQRIVTLRHALAPERKGLTKLFDRERLAAQRNIERVVNKQQEDLRALMSRFRVDYLSSPSVSQPADDYLARRATTANGMDRRPRTRQGQGLRPPGHGGAAQHRPFTVTGAVPNISSQGSAIFDTDGILDAVQQQQRLLPPMQHRFGGL